MQRIRQAVQEKANGSGGVSAATREYHKSPLSSLNNTSSGGSGANRRRPPAVPEAPSTALTRGLFKGHADDVSAGQLLNQHQSQGDHHTGGASKCDPAVSRRKDSAAPPSDKGGSGVPSPKSGGFGGCPHSSANPSDNNGTNNNGGEDGHEAEGGGQELTTEMVTSLLRRIINPIGRYRQQ